MISKPNKVTTSHVGAWWQSSTRAEPLVCVYCGAQTSGAENDEHVLPESLGSKTTLYKGAVCNRCNHALGKNVERNIFKESLMASGQVAQETEGKKGVRPAIGKHVRKEGNKTIIRGATSGLAHEFPMGRAVAKCGINIFTHHFGSEAIREKFPDLIDYVVQPKGRADIWPYAAAFTPVGGFGVGFGVETVETSDGPYPMFVFACASGVFASVPIRTIPDAAETAHAYLATVLADAEAKRGAKVISMTYVAKGNL